MSLMDELGEAELLHADAFSKLYVAFEELATAGHRGSSLTELARLTEETVKATEKFAAKGREVLAVMSRLGARV